MEKILSRNMRLPALPIRVVFTDRAYDWTLINEGGKTGYYGTWRSQIELVAKDAREIRSSFMEIRTEQDVLIFLRDTQCFWGDPARKKDKVTMFFEDVDQLQQLVRDAAEREVNQWVRLSRKYGESWLDDLMREPIITVDWASARPHAIVKIEENSDYPLLTTIGGLMQIERLCGLMQRVCIMKGCQKVFPPSDKRQVYCSNACAHLAAVRRSRGQ
jgi:hypothetical protein